jgi:hypothetical protein
LRLSRPDRRVSDLASRVPGVALAATLLAGCGSGHATPTLPGSAASVMTTHLRNAAAAAGSQDRAGAAREIDAFAADVSQQKAAGHLSQADYAALEAGIGRTRSRIAAELPVVTPPATPAAVAPVAAAPSAPVQQIVVQGNGDGKVKIKGDGGRAKGVGKATGDGGNGNGDGGG